MQKALRARAGQVDGRESQVFDLEGKIRSCAKQDLAHMQLLLDSKVMKTFSFYTIPTLDTV